MRDSPCMRELKAGLDRIGVKYSVEDFEDADPEGDGETYIQCVAWESGGVTQKAMYGWCVDYNGDRSGVTLGWRFGYLEWWPHGMDGESVIATPDEIVEAMS